MNKLFSVFLFLSFSIILKSQDFFDINTIQTIEINFVQNNWDDILDSYYTAGSEYRLIGTATINGIQFDSVGVRYKGNSSYDATQAKNPLNIKLDYVKGKQEIEGRNVLKLSNVVGDPTFVREVLSYEIARKYMPASESNFAKVFINGAFIGLYVNDESTNTAFAARHYFKGNNPFFEGEFTPGAAPTGCISSSPSVWAYLGSSQNCYEQYYQLQSSNPNDWNDLINALDTFNNYTSYIENAFYIDRLLWMLALDNILVNLDSPLDPPHNFLIYKDKTDRFNPIIWDLNQSFGSYTGSTSNSLTPTELKELSPWHNATNTNYPIMNIPFANDRYKKMYIAKMKTIFNENINNDLYAQRVTDLQNLISTEVSNDPNKFYSDAEFSQNVTTTVQGIIGIQELIEDRKVYLTSQADFVKIQPNISNITHSPSRVFSNSTVTISADITDINYAHLAYRFSPKEKFKTVQMMPIGNTYSATISVEKADVQYYIWAENNNAGIFSPERAEYEFHRIGVTGDLVINELQASNESTEFDEAAEYDDWIELYNNTSSPIDLTGYYLTDNKDTLTKWSIPSQTIEANDFLIFWADKDIAQGLNHTNFQLTRNGESLYLVDPNQIVIDQITYPYQERNLSYSRFPNGTGPFIIKEATFNDFNGDTISGINQFNTIHSLNIFPNPTNNVVYIQGNDVKLHTGQELNLIDDLGNTVYKKKISTNNLESINVKAFAKGVYFLKISGFETKKVIIK